ncbi:N-acetylmuramic acid 6-phosphate etherase [Desulfosporosinus fructosivorans]|uniref:N-acetylmuramic acid 6-phosphate etherase n=1 Tax=Desulfosporosinus fructosivorans TaxID=2018669 RepID=A0A4Z0R8X8_9FIRM|nr:N-acetylmuramic acid 6-phosphate etherase [Desulfosporosinus fructosivorans]TGE39631.1 N-acetylmuramic acid 6-phosphate etherase [Desulfosporosinus fructosivorans]
MNLEKLLTEARNPETENIDELATLEILRCINQEDKKVALAIELVLPQIAQAVDWIVESLSGGGRLFYLGAGTSGRMGILDASECPPTFGTSPDLVQGVIAGGEKAVFRAVEGAEDSLTMAAEDLLARDLNPRDVVVGIAASGRTPYVIGGLEYARQLGCHTVAVVCTPDSEMQKVSELSIAILVGPEVIMGSTRMKAGTAQKLVLNMLTTASMIRMGKVYGNLMVDVQATNKKLVERSKRIVCLATGVSREEAEAAIVAAGGSVKVAVTLLLIGSSAVEAQELLVQVGGSVSQALRVFKQN